MSEFSEEHRERIDRLREEKCEIQIYEKATGKFVDHKRAYYDDAKRVARNAIAGKPHLGFKIIKPL